MSPTSRKVLAAFASLLMTLGVTTTLTAAPASAAVSAPALTDVPRRRADRQLDWRTALATASYRVQLRDVNNSSIIDTVNVPASPGATPYTSALNARPGTGVYRITVSTMNSSNGAIGSITSLSVTRSAPAQPESVTLVQDGNNLLASWVAPEDTGGVQLRP